MMEASQYPYDWVTQDAEFIVLYTGCITSDCEKKQTIPDYKAPLPPYLAGDTTTRETTTFPPGTTDWWCNVGPWKPATPGTTTPASGPERVVHVILDYTPNSLKEKQGNPNLNPRDVAEFNDVLSLAKRVHCAGNVLLTDRDDAPGNGQYDPPHDPSYWDLLVNAVKNGV
jgi:hypothetical protein